MPLSPYISFAGHCADAIAYYHKTLGAELLYKITFGEMPPPEQGSEDGCPSGMQFPDTSIAHANVRITGASRCVQGEFIGKLKLRLEQRDRDKVGRMAHRINGGARMMNYTPLKETCEALEVACNNEQDWETIEQLVKCVLEDMVRFNKWLAEKS